MTFVVNLFSFLTSLAWYVVSCLILYLIMKITVSPDVEMDTLSMSDLTILTDSAHRDLSAVTVGEKRFMSSLKIYALITVIITIDDLSCGTVLGVA